MYLTRLSACALTSFSCFALAVMSFALLSSSDAEALVADVGFLLIPAFFIVAIKGGRPWRLFGHATWPNALSAMLAVGFFDHFGQFIYLTLLLLPAVVVDLVWCWRIIQTRLRIRSALEQVPVAAAAPSP